MSLLKKKLHIDMNLESCSKFSRLYCIACLESVIIFTAYFSEAIQ